MRKRTFAGIDVNDLPLYTVWCGIKSRCYNPKAANYKYYGAKGVIICEQWKNDFINFNNWFMKKGWKKGLTIDRFPDRNGNYEPKNCRVATMKQQASNRDFGNAVNNFKGINEKRRLQKLTNGSPVS